MKFLGFANNYPAVQNNLQAASAYLNLNGPSRIHSSILRSPSSTHQIGMTLPSRRSYLTQLNAVPDSASNNPSTRNHNVFAIDPSLIVKDTPNLTLERVTFKSAESECVGHLYLPTDRSEEMPVVVLCHGFCGVKELLLPNFAKLFAAQGIAAFTFDYRGFGESEGKHGLLDPNLQIEDIHAAINFIETHEAINKDKIALWGTSYGGANAICAASTDDRVKTVCVQLTFGDGERVVTGDMPETSKAKLLNMFEKCKSKEGTPKERMVTIKQALSDPQSQEFYDRYHDEYPELDIKIPFLTTSKTLNHKPELYLPVLQAPLHITSAKNDLVNPAKESEILFEKANTPKAHNIIEDAGHFDVYEGDHLQKAAAGQIAWIKKHLDI